MCHVKNNLTSERYKINAEQYEEARNIFNNINKGHIVTQSTRKKISDKNTGKFIGENNPFYGKSHTKETKEKISKALMGKYVVINSYNYGKKPSVETRQKMSEAKRDIFNNEKNPNSKKIVCDNMVFDCIKSCADYYNTSVKTLYTYLYDDGKRMSKKWKEKGLKYVEQ